MRFRALDALIGHIFFERRHESWQIILDPCPHVRSICCSNPDSRDSSTGSVRPFRAIGVGSRYRHWNTMVAVECAVYWHLLGLSFSFPNWLESRDVRRHRSSLLPSSFWPISCSLFAPWTLGVALGLRKQDLEYGEFQPSPARIGRRHRFHQAP